MPIEFTCPHCKRSASVPDQYAGRSGPCVTCGGPITIPAAAPGTGSPQAETPGASRFAEDERLFDPPAAGDIGDDPAMRMLLPVGRSAWAIVAGYLGLFSVVCVFAPFAVIAGVLAIRDIRRNSELHGMGRAIFGLVMGIVFSIVLLIMLFGMYMAA